MKETFYFSHDNNAFNDDKILELRFDMGIEGYGLFWAVIEFLANQDEYKLEAKRKHLLSIYLGIDKATDGDILVIPVCMDATTLEGNGWMEWTNETNWRCGHVLSSLPAVIPYEEKLVFFWNGWTVYNKAIFRSLLALKHLGCKIYVKIKEKENK